MKKAKCPVCKGTGLIKTSDWLIKGMTEEELAKEKEEALRDIVEVVRCKDCKYWQDNNDGYPYDLCAWREDETPDADDYCSYGERNENE